MRRFALPLVVALSFGCSKKETPSEPPVKTTAAARSELLRVGDVAPAFETTAHNGEKVELAKLRGKSVVLYFYPKDDTPGCTVEAQKFRDEAPALAEASAVVLGVSTDDNESHRAFAEKHALPFLLLPDTESAIARAYGVDSTLGMSKRVTFLIDPNGTIAKVYPSVDPDTHSDEILRDLGALAKK